MCNRKWKWRDYALSFIIFASIGSVFCGLTSIEGLITTIIFTLGGTMMSHPCCSDPNPKQYEDKE